MKSKVKKLLAGVVAAVLLGLGASSAQAGFEIRELRTTSGGVDTVNLYAFNNGAGGSGTKVLGIEVTVNALGVSSAVAAGSGIQSIAVPGMGGSVLANGLDVYLVDTDEDGFPDAVDVTGMSSTTKSYLRAGTTATWVGTLSSTDANFLDGEVDFMSHTGFNNAGGLIADSTSPSGYGARFAVLRVPAGSAIQVAGKIGSETLFEQVINTNDAAIPEPATLGLLSLGALGLMARRRRA